MKSHANAPITTKAMGLSNEIDELDEMLEGMLAKFSSAAKITPKELVARIVYKCFSGMCEVLEFAADYPEGSDKHDEVFELISNYDGGNYIYEEMKKIDPEYQSPEEWMMSLDDSSLDSLAAAIPQSSLKALPQ